VTDIVIVRKILAGNADSTRVRLRGWLHNRRSSGGILFLIIRDGTGFLQCTAKKDQLGEKFSEIETLPLESTVEVEGEIVRDPRAPRGYELRITDLLVLHRSHEDFPIAKKYHGPEFLLDNRHFWIRSKKMQTILRVRALVIDESRRWLKEHGNLEVHVPIIVSAAV
jgi:asparaginyl-tRNA synthetase